MLNTDDACRYQEEDQEELSPGQVSFHCEDYPHLLEFSEFISGVHIDSLKFKLMTFQQRLAAQSFWAAENYGGSEANCAKHLKEVYGPKWYQITSVSEHMQPIRIYCEYILILEHKRQWDKRKKSAKLLEVVND
jgi:hypothetical protein